jgi:hypothetical protein
MHPSALNRPVGVIFIVSSLAFGSPVRPRESDAKAGTQGEQAEKAQQMAWIPAYAGMSG